MSSSFHNKHKAAAQTTPVEPYNTAAPGIQVYLPVQQDNGASYGLGKKEDLFLATLFLAVIYRLTSLAKEQKIISTA